MDGNRLFKDHGSGFLPAFVADEGDLDLVVLF
jgi:hypothetical protein